MGALQLEMHRLDRRFQHLRIRHPARYRHLLADLAESGQQTPILVIAAEAGAEQPSGSYVVLDGFQRLAALQQLQRDTVAAVVLELDEACALLLLHALRSHEPEQSALEHGWFFKELRERFGYTIEQLAEQCGRHRTWIQRRLALVEALPENVQRDYVRTGLISPQIAMRYLAPVAKVSVEHCQSMAEAIAQHARNGQQAAQLYRAWRRASQPTRQRLLEQPELFFKTLEQQTPPPASALERDLQALQDIAQRAHRRLQQQQQDLTFEQRHQAARAIQNATGTLSRMSQQLTATLPQ